MSDADRERWEAKHERASGSDLPAALPSLAWLPRAEAGAKALDVACGRGRNAGQLLVLGYQVTCVDIARAALRELAHAHRGERRLGIVQADLDAWPFADGVFDLVVQTDFLDRKLFSSIRRSLKAGGHVLVDTFCRAESAADGAEARHGPSRADFLLERGELQRVFAAWDVIRIADTEGPAPRAALLARKPAR